MRTSTPSKIQASPCNAEISHFLTHPLHPIDLQTLQVNIGRRCNQLCNHCHLDASLTNVDHMPKKIMKQVLQFARRIRPELLDITGGAPELHPHLCFFIDSADQFIPHIQVRTNLTVLSQPNMDLSIPFFKEKQVKLVASLPSYLREEVNSQRGEGVFETSIRMLQQLNRQGYGIDPRLPLDLVHNPTGAFLPPQQSELEMIYRERLATKYNIVFNQLLTITNMPIGRFYNFLQQTNQEKHYWELLTATFNSRVLDQLMCRHQIHVGPSGRVHDCDFNFALGLPSQVNPQHVSQISSHTLLSRDIVTGTHCLGCTAGYGSSCAGAFET